MIMALKTADFTTHVFLYDRLDSPKPLGSLEWESGRQLSEQLLAKLESFMKEHDAVWSDLTGLIVFSGPGSFTSLRIGHATFNALADSLGIPVVGAAGDDWQRHGLAIVKSAKLGFPAVPQYGSDAHITMPKS